MFNKKMHQHLNNIERAIRDFQQYSISSMEERLNNIEKSILRAEETILSLMNSAQTSIDLVKDHSFYNRHHSYDLLKMLRLAALGPERVVEFWYQGSHHVRMFVPNGAMDHIQSFYILYETFWDIENLLFFSNFVRDKVILDIGANVGNHAIFWSMVSGARQVESFEPVPITFQILERNIALNNISNIRTHQLALADKAAQGSVSNAEAANRMIAQIQDDIRGQIKMAALDDLNVTEADFAKIDVEGFTLPLLQGACHTLSRLKPAIFIELYAHEYDQCAALLTDIGYRKIKDFPESNYLFVHPERGHAEEFGLRFD